MSGHSKWNNIKRKKEKTDAVKAKIFTKIGKEMAVAIKAGGANPDNNSRLRELIAKAKANNVPNDNIERCIKKFSENSNIDYKEMVYEGYGPSGVAFIVKTSTDNINRTAGNVRSYFSKYGGNMGQTGCVGFMFEDRGVIEIYDEDGEVDEDKLMEDAIESGASDFVSEGEGYFKVYTEVDEYMPVAEELKAKGYNITSADNTKVPANYVDIEDEEIARQLENMIDKFEDDDDVTDVYHNWNI
ncbi:MAG: YebC/PmpR family DNA-binding transcriptional regulator [Clostridia bacterium]|nr:YebC/PmpR family DNA-binding transcriptional regulator [Clostridia bacterium]